MYHNAKGNISIISNIGSFNYKETANAGTYAISSVDFNLASGETTQNISYTAFDKIKQLSHINTNGILSGKIEISYGLDQQRLYQTTTLENGTTKEKYFIGGLYEKEISDGSIKELCYISTPAGTVAIKETQNNIDNWLFLTHDHLGSVHCIMNEEGRLEQELSFDPYGNRRDPVTWKPYEEGQEPVYLIDRGYTFHEHWDDFDLINMNGRVYDPVIARFLSPDPYVQSPGYSQNFNRYSYVLNNPLKYTDPDGEWIHLAIGAVVGGVFNWATHGADFDLDGAKYFAIGAVAGALAAGVGAGVGAALAGNVAAGGGFAAGFIGTQTITSTGFAAGAISGGFAGVSNGLVMGTGNGMMVGQSFGEALITGGFDQSWKQGLGGSVFGGIMGGIDAKRLDRNFWTGSRSQEVIGNTDSVISTNDYLKRPSEQNSHDVYIPEKHEPFSMEVEVTGMDEITSVVERFPLNNPVYVDVNLNKNSATFDFPLGTQTEGHISLRGWRWNHNIKILQD